MSILPRQATAERKREDKENARWRKESSEKRERWHKQRQIIKSLLETICDKVEGVHYKVVSL